MREIGSTCTFGVFSLSFVAFLAQLWKFSLDNVAFVFFSRIFPLWALRRTIAHWGTLYVLTFFLRVKVFWTHNCPMLPDIKLAKCGEQMGQITHFHGATGCVCGSQGRTMFGMVRLRGKF